MSNVKFDIPEWVNWLARDANGSLYGYRNKPRKHIISWSIGTVCVDTNTWFVGNLDIDAIVSGDYYKLDIDGGQWCWTDEMLEEVIGNEI